MSEEQKGYVSQDGYHKFLSPTNTPKEAHLKYRIKKLRETLSLIASWSSEDDPDDGTEDCAEQVYAKKALAQDDRMADE